METTIKDNASLLTNIERELMIEIIGYPCEGEMADWDNVILIKKYADESGNRSAKYLFEKLIHNTKYEQMATPLIDNTDSLLVAEVNKAYWYDFKRFMLILTALAYKYQRFIERAIKEPLTKDYILLNPKQIINCLGSKDLLIIALFCTDELNDKCIEYYIKNM